MKVVFWASSKDREQELAHAFLAGARAHGWDTEKRDLCARPRVDDYDVGCMVGVKSAELFRAHKQAGTIPLMIDKGYIRSRAASGRVWEYWRVAVNAHHPTENSLTLRKMPPDRFEKLGVEIGPWRGYGLQVVIAGSSAKYHQFYGLPHPTEYWTGIIANLASMTDRPIIYRPKPSWKDAAPIRSSLYSGPKDHITDVLNNAHCLITHGSNACFEAAIMGIPSIILGDGVMKSISSTSLDDLDAPRLGKREQLLCNLAYHQWNMQEFSTGEAWATMKGWVERELKRA